ncbi:MAG: TraX family protein [Desulfitobacteriaceae bacterium]|nr:TraX family protein [Desulfitobacteriaceae bacterium]
MSSFQIKIAACFFMLVDHIGVIFFPEQITWRLIGRLAFPLFAWAIANGFRHTRNVSRYLGRLFFFGIIIQIPYTLYFNSWYLNIFFTLSLGLLAIIIFSRLADRSLGYLMVFILACLGEVLGVDYGLYGVLTIFFFYLYFNDVPRLLLAQGLLNLGRILLPLMATAFDEYTLSDMDFIQPAALLALGFVLMFNGTKGRGWKYLFYIFYPAHLAALYGFKLLLENSL